jgi:hypothetical protein
MRIVRSKKGIALVALAAAAALALAAGALAVFPNDSITHYTGCLNTNASPGGTFANVAVGDTPAKACGSGQVLVHLSGGDITAVGTAAGSGLTGGKDNGAASLALDSTGCSSGGVLKWNGTSWSCGSDNNSTYSGSDFALSNQNCTSGQFDTGVDATGHLSCAAPPLADTYFASNGEDAGSPPGVLSDGQLHQIISLSVPAGSYAVTAKGSIDDVDRASGTVCRLLSNGTRIDFVIANTGGDIATTPVTLMGAATMSSNGTFSVACSTDYAGVTASEFKILALKVGAIH